MKKAIYIQKEDFKKVKIILDKEHIYFGNELTPYFHVQTTIVVSVLTAILTSIF